MFSAAAAVIVKCYNVPLFLCYWMLSWVLLGYFNDTFSSAADLWYVIIYTNTVLFICCTSSAHFIWALLVENLNVTMCAVRYCVMLSSTPGVLLMCYDVRCCCANYILCWVALLLYDLDVKMCAAAVLFRCYVVNLYVMLSAAAVLLRCYTVCLCCVIYMLYFVLLLCY